MVLRGRNPSRRPSVAAAPVGLGLEALAAKETPAPAATASPKAPQPPKQAAVTKAAPAAKAGKKTGPAEAAPASAAGSSAGLGSGGSGSSSSSSGSGKKTQTPEFLVKLHRILQNEDPDIILWDNGQIHVKNPTVLGEQVLHKYFRHSKYSSFQRQLNYFGFRKTQGKGKMSACTYTNVQLTHGNLKGLLHIKRKSSGPSTGGASSGSSKDKGLELDEEAEFEAALLAAGETDASDNEEEEEEEDEMEDDDDMEEEDDEEHTRTAGSSNQRKRARSSSSSYATSVAAESLAVDEGAEEEEMEEEGGSLHGSEGATSAGAGSHSGYTSCLSDNGQEEEEEEEAEAGNGRRMTPEEAERDAHNRRRAVAAFVAAASNGDRGRVVGPSSAVHGASSSGARVGGIGGQGLTFTIGSRTGGKAARLSTATAAGPSPTIATPSRLAAHQPRSSASSTAAAAAAAMGLGKLDIPTFLAGPVLPAPSPRGADDPFPSCLAAFDGFTYGDGAIGHANSPWGGNWAEPPVFGSLSSLSSGATTLASLAGDEDEGNSNHSLFAPDRAAAAAAHGDNTAAAAVDNEPFWALPLTATTAH